MTYPGCFITLEGGEGAGKTTHIDSIRQYLTEQGIPFITTREPGGTVVSEAVRGILLDVELPVMHCDTELLLIFAARNEHLQQVIVPALKTGTWVICDRFTDASYAYQGYGRGLPVERIAALETWVQGNLRPDYTLLFDIDVRVSQQRVQNRSVENLKQIDRFEQENIDFHEKIRHGYLQRANLFPQRIITIQAGRELNLVKQEVSSALATIVANQMTDGIAGRVVE